MVRKNQYRESYVPANIDIDYILAETSVLITDYSSTFFDFLITDRPVVFYVPDYEDYKKNRGVYMPLDSLPGPICKDKKSLAEVLGNLGNIAEYFDKDNYANGKKLLCNEDGRVCSRIVENIFFGSQKDVIRNKNEKPKVLFHTDIILKNGISTSALNLLNLIDKEKYDITFYAVGEEDEVRRYVNSLPDEIRVIYRGRKTVGDAEGLGRLNYCMENAITEVDNDPIYPFELYQDEYKRCFGDADFDYIINFSGFSYYFTNLYATNKKAVKLIWMHNVMQQEYNREADGEKVFQKSLDCVYKLYRSYDWLVSCSRTTMLHNRVDLKDKADYDQFTYLSNTLNSARVLNGAENKSLINVNENSYLVIASEEETNICVRKPDPDKANFVTVGRLAEAKNHENLIKGFLKFHEEHPASALYIVGDGPLRLELSQLVRDLGLEDSVTITGNISNPFALLSMCDCFILPSYYEGQPMVLLEARTLNLSVIISDFSTAEDSSFPEGQLIIGKTAEDITEGLRKYVNGEVPNKYRFDPDAYNAEILNALYELMDRGAFKTWQKNQ